MKYCLLVAFAILFSEAKGQIVFEEVPSPEDFSLEDVWKSPTGEYFVQAYDDDRGLYSSFDGEAWTRAAFPASILGEINMEFFDDGTPVAWHGFGDRMIRRDGSWYTFRISPPLPNVKASFIRNDTLFAYSERRFAFSLDKGVSFTTLFTTSQPNIVHSAHVWVSDRYFILHHTIGATDYLSVFNRTGSRIMFREIDFYIRDFLHVSCGEILLTAYDEYYRLSLTTLEESEGAIQALYPGFDSSMDIQAQAGYYYILDGATLLRNPGCGGVWEPWISDPMLDSFAACHVTPGEEIILDWKRSDRFLERPGETSEWQEVLVSADDPFVELADEAFQGHQMCVTPNAFFRKQYTDMAWTEGDIPFPEVRDFQYGPDGKLYVSSDAGIFVSADNGLTFDTLPLPPLAFPVLFYDFRVLSEDVLFYWDRLTDQIYYSVDRGESWIEGPQLFLSLYPYKVKLAGHYIIIAEFGITIELVRINLANGEWNQVGLNVIDGSEYFDVEILEDGSIYYLKSSFVNPEHSGLFRYRFGGIPEYLGPTSQFLLSEVLLTSRNVLFGLGLQTGYALDGDALVPISIVGLPFGGAMQYRVAANQHVYVIFDNDRIFRSVEPLTYAQNLAGHITLDANEDCVADSLDGGLKGWQVTAASGQHILVRTTNADGRYQFNLPVGEYTITATPINAEWMLCADSYPVSVEIGTQADVPGFSAIAQSDCASLDIDFSTPLLRRCFDNTYFIRVRNTGPGASSGTQLRLELDPFFDFISATHPYSMEGDSILLFDLGVLEVNAEVFIRVVFNLSCEADLGMTHCLSGQLVDDNLCGNDRSAYTECQENIGSYDPNDKRTFNAAGWETQTVDKDEFIYYHIRFQNTGTDTAFRVRILDTLSTRLDPRTLEMLSASHPFTHAVNDGPILEVVFDDIFLPDSNVNEAASHGFFKFRIKPYPQYDYGTLIPNDASIYFDYNDAVITPEAVLVLQQPVRTSEPAPSLSFDLTPNPATDWIVVRPDPGSPVQPDGYRITDRLGRVVAAAALQGDMRVEVSGLVPGVYHLAVLSDGVMVGGKVFVKM